ncbi:MAG: ABC transporter ATP-binding protein [Bacillota bacterium]|nr:ABC transporter ATP-binding protein [Bacillota bacterium]
MKRLLRYLKGVWLIVILCPLVMVIEVLCDLMQPKILAGVIDVGVANHDIAYVYDKGLLLILLALAGMVSGLVCVILATLASTHFSYNLRLDLFKKIQSFDFKSINKIGTSSLIVRMTNDVVALQDILMQALRMMVRAPLLFIGGIIMAVTINYRLALVLLFSVPVLVLVIRSTIMRGFPFFKQVQNKLDGLNNIIRENLLGIRVVKNYVKEDKETARFADEADSLANINIHANQIMALIGPVMNLVMNITIVAVLWFGGYLFKSHLIMSGSIISFITYITQILSALTMLSMILINISRVKVSVNRVIEVLDTDPSIEGPSLQSFNLPKVESGEIKFENVSFTYNAGTNEDVLTDINLNIKSGETVAILGGTGAGKSTLINLIPRLYDPVKGIVKVGGHDIKEYSIKHLRENISMVMQSIILFTDTIRENLLKGDENATEEDLFKACETACAEEFINQLPEGLDTLLERGGRNLSGGQRQRLCIARALVKKSKIIIFDDALSAVDTTTDAKIRAGIKKNYKDITCIIITQRILSAKNADRIFVLDNGKLAAEGSHDELLKNSSIYKEIYSSQLEMEL